MSKESNDCYLTLMSASGFPQSYILSSRWNEGTNEKKSGEQPRDPSMRSSVLGQGRHFSYRTLNFLEQRSQASAAEKHSVSVIYDQPIHFQKPLLIASLLHLRQNNIHLLNVVKCMLHLERCLEKMTVI